VPGDRAGPSRPGIANGSGGSGASGSRHRQLLPGNFLEGGLRQEEEEARFPRVMEVPFDSQRRRMATVHLAGSRRVAYVKGAPEEILRLSALAPGQRRRAEEAAASMERDALRVLGEPTRER